MADICRNILYFGTPEPVRNAALGAAASACACGKKTLYCQFRAAAKLDYSFKTLRLTYLEPKFPPKKDYSEMNEEEKRISLLDGADYLERAIRAAANGGYELMVLDGICDAIAFGALYEGVLTDYLAQRPASTEVIVTGRYGSAKTAAYCDEIINFAEVIP